MIPFETVVGHDKDGKPFVWFLDKVNENKDSRTRVLNFIASEIDSNKGLIQLLYEALQREIN